MRDFSTTAIRRKSQSTMHVTFSALHISIKMERISYTNASYKNNNYNNNNWTGE